MALKEIRQAESIDNKALPLIKTKKVRVGSEAFPLEYSPQVREESLYNDIVSYLGEYRFKVEKYNYNLVYSQGEDGTFHVRDRVGGEAMIDVGKRAIEDRRLHGTSLDKSVADLLGMQQLDAQLAHAQDGDTIIYGSPPDPEVGYTYGFMYLGHVRQSDGGVKNLEMQAIRLDNDPTLEQYNTAIKLVSGNDVHFSTPNEFIANPIIVNKNISSLTSDFILKGVFDFQVDMQKQQFFQEVIEDMDPLIQHFIASVKTGTSQSELQPIFNALENYALHLLAEKENGDTHKDDSIRREVRIYEDRQKNRLQPIPVGEIMKSFSHEPPKVIGSCGSSGTNKSNDTFGNGSIFGSVKKNFTGSKNESEDKYGSRTFDCPSCHQKNERPYNELLPECQHCGSKDVAC